MHILQWLNHVLTVISWERETTSSALKCCLIFHVQCFYHSVFVAFLKNGENFLYDLEKMRIFYTYFFGNFSQFLIKLFILREIDVCNLLMSFGKMWYDIGIDSMWLKNIYCNKKLSSATYGYYNRIDRMWFLKNSTLQFLKMFRIHLHLYESAKFIL